MEDRAMTDRMNSEVILLKNLSNKNVIQLLHNWYDYKHGTLNFITEACSSGNLREYKKKHKQVSLLAIKNWSRQILQGLVYLHTYRPFIAHWDLNCSNVYINGNTGVVKIGDFGLAKALGNDHVAHSVLGTPEFMAPEVFEENYTEAVDVYVFRMCVLELVTREIPYMECDSLVKIYKKVSSGVKPMALNKVKSQDVKAFITKCLAKQEERPSASELLKDSFFDGLRDFDRFLCKYFIHIT